MSAIDPDKQAIVQELMNRRATLSPDKQAIVDELGSRFGLSAAVPDVQPRSPQQQAEAMASRKTTPAFQADPTAQFRQAQETQLQRLPVGLGLAAATGLAGEAAPALAAAAANPAVREVAKKALPYAIGSAIGGSAPPLLKDLIKHYLYGR